MQLYGSASAEPFFVACFSGEQGSTTAHLRRLPRKGRAGGAFKSLLKHRVQGTALPAMLPSSPSADLSQCAFLRLCFGRAVFCCPFPGERGSTTAHLRRLPRKGRAGGAEDLCSSIACRAQPCQRCTPVLQALICFRCIFTALLRQSRFCFGQLEQAKRSESCAQKEHPRAFGPGVFCCDRKCQVEAESIFCSWVLAR